MSFVNRESSAEDDERIQVEAIKRLTEIHIKRFTNRIRVGNDPNSFGSAYVNVPECEAYLALWKSIEAKGYDWTKLTIPERDEIAMAIASGE